MECINHPGIQAAGTCQKCGKALCAPCMTRFSPPLCEPCLLSHNAAVARRLYIDIGVTVFLFLAVVIAMGMQTPPRLQAGFVFGPMLSCAYWGWQFLSSFSVPIVFTSGFGLMTYLVIKFMLSICFGFIAAPWQILKRIKSIHAIEKLKKQIQQGQA